MITDYSEITASLDKKLDLMNHAFNDKLYYVAGEILADINKDLEKLVGWLKEREDDRF